MKANGPLVNLLLAAATCAVVVTNIGSLVVMAEIMALCAAFSPAAPPPVSCGLRWGVSVLC